MKNQIVDVRYEPVTALPWPLMGQVSGGNDLSPISRGQKGGAPPLNCDIPLVLKDEGAFDSILRSTGKADHRSIRYRSEQIVKRIRNID